MPEISDLLSISKTSILRWIKCYREHGVTQLGVKRKLRFRYNTEQLQFLANLVKDDPCFYLCELQAKMKAQFPNLKNLSLSTLCRALNQDLCLTRKKMQIAARERSITDRFEYWLRLKSLYTHSSQLVFLDETSKDGRAGRRLRGRSVKGEIAAQYLPNSRGDRLSALAFFDETGFMDWAFISGTYSREIFHRIVIDRLIPLLNPYPLPRSIVVLDNASIHHYPELICAIRSQGAEVIFLPPYSPDFNPIEVAFSLIKFYCLRNHTEYAASPFIVLQRAFQEYSESTCTTNLFRHCGYDGGRLTPINLV